MKRAMKTRIALGVVMIAAVCAVLWLDWWLERRFCDRPAEYAEWLRIVLHGLPTTVVLVALAVAAFSELARLAAGAGAGILPAAGTVGAVAVATCPRWCEPLWSNPPLPDSGLFLAGSLVWSSGFLMLLFVEQMVRHRTDGAVRRIGATLLAVAYIGIGLALILCIRLLDVAALVVFLAAVKFTDIGAYFAGSAIGRHKMIPWLSPGKSWEGLAGGLIAAAAVSVLAARLLAPRIETWQAAVFGVAVGLAGQFGDLCESLLKRSAQMKDSGAVVPEFGGVLDIIDSPLLAAPVALLMLEMFGRWR